eukprot:CAMPEP_0197196572 /NCGR_PEP_ID=MMETSP1423-20130617/32428_1 /TAXON_ID=476441 /ORGANISM="Pseudo-nitzschia heimii, Strain UNC1101" /LENGTH=137 /DNA_ID=CAMNT_0042650379 /DNA_START=46 /DNA_END=459 /DNA_ORIENTATION=-
MNVTVDVVNDADKEKGGNLPAMATATEVGVLYWYVLAGPLFAGAILAAVTNAGGSSSWYPFLCEFAFVFLLFGPLWIGFLLCRMIALLPGIFIRRQRRRGEGVGGTTEPRTRTDEQHVAADGDDIGMPSTAMAVTVV